MEIIAEEGKQNQEAAKINLKQLEASLRQAVERDSANAEAHFTLGLVCKSTRRLEEAVRCFAQAITLIPDYPEAYNSLALTLCTLNRLEQARDCLKRAVDLRPDYAEAHNNLGIVQVRMKQEEEAVESFQKAVRLDPENPNGLNNLGLSLYNLERYEEAQVAFSQAVMKNAGFTEAHYNLGRALKKLNRPAEAEPCFRRTIELNPDHLQAYDKLAAVLILLNRFAEAETWLRQAIAISPEHAGVHRRLGRLLKKMHRMEEAEASYLRAIEVGAPEEAENSLYGLGIFYLLRGDYSRGWKYYDLRRTLYHYPEPEFHRWQGEDLAGRSILLFCEQGFGDTLQFVRYAAKVASLAGQTDIRVQEPLQRLVAASLPGCTVYAGSVRPSEYYDFTCSLHSLPFVLQSTGTPLSIKTPYLCPTPDVIKKWQRILNHREKTRCFRIGIVWAGNPRHHNDHNRSIPFDLFRQLLNFNSATWVSLQVGDRAQDLSPVSDNVFDAAPELTDYAETAGLVQNLDLVITVDSSVAHLSAAMGKETWVLLPYSPDWRWQLDREDSPWYETVRLFRQKRIGDWQEVLRQVGAALTESIIAE